MKRKCYWNSDGKNQYINFIYCGLALGVFLLPWPLFVSFVVPKKKSDRIEYYWFFTVAGNVIYQFLEQVLYFLEWVLSWWCIFYFILFLFYL